MTYNVVLNFKRFDYYYFFSAQTFSIIKSRNPQKLYWNKLGYSFIQLIHSPIAQMHNIYNYTCIMYIYVIFTNMRVLQHTKHMYMIIYM
jgi:hypothetical protein